MTYRQIESSRETRLWIKEIIIPIVVVGGYIFSKPENRCMVKNKFESMKRKVKNKFTKK